MAVARLEDRLGHLAPGAAVRDADHGIDRLAVGIHDLDHRNARRLQHRPRGLGMFQPGDDHPRGAPRQHFVQNPLFLFRQIVGDADHRLQHGVFQHLIDAGQHLGEHHVGQRRDDHRHQVDPARSQRAGDLVGHIAQLFRCGEHPFAGGVRDVAPVAQHPADRHLGHARRFGNIAQGQRAFGIQCHGEQLSKGTISPRYRNFTRPFNNLFRPAAGVGKSSHDIRRR